MEDIANVEEISYSSAFSMIERIYKQTKEAIPYEALHWVMVSIALFLMFMKLFDEYQRVHQGQTRMDWGAYWRQAWIYIVVCVFACCASDIFNLVETILFNAQTEAIKGMNYDVNGIATSGIKSAIKNLLDQIPDFSLFDFNLFDFIGGLISTVIAIIFVPIYGYVYFFYLAGRSMWLLMLDFIAPVAIMTCIHENTRTYFYTWLKNMFICYMLLPMFLLADIFSNLLIREICTLKGSYFIMQFLLIAGIWIKIKMFSVVRQKTMQLF